MRSKRQGKRGKRGKRGMARQGSRRTSSGKLWHECEQCQRQRIIIGAAMEAHPTHAANLLRNAGKNSHIVLDGARQVSGKKP